jgi:hypothetical protein
MNASVTLTREELYNQVWAEPLIRLAATYGLTGNGLKKICRKANIPVPPRGYWRRRQVGRSDPRPPLPPARPGTSVKLTISASPIPTVAKEAAARIDSDLPTEHPIVVADRLVSPHPLIQATRLALESDRVDDEGAVHGHRNQPRLDVRVSKASLARALRILDALFKALEARGATVQLDPQHEHRSCVKIGAETITFRVEEEFTRQDHVPTKTDKPYLTPKWDHVATGNLTFHIDEWADGVRKTWRDGKTRRLEDLLPDILKGFLVIAEALRTRRVAREREEQARKEAEARQAELERQRREEAARRQTLEDQVNCWVMSRNLRTFLDAVEDEARNRGVSASPDTDFGRWLAWARQHADRLDPVQVILQPAP